MVLFLKLLIYFVFNANTVMLKTILHLINFPIYLHVALKNITFYCFFIAYHFLSYRCPPLLQRYKFKVTISVTTVPPPISLQFILAFKKIYSTLLSFFY